MTINRLTTALLIATFFFAAKTKAQNQLLIPDTLSGTQITLNLQNGTWQFYSGINTTTMGTNGNILGPSLILNKGQQVSITVNNQLADTTTIHWHGMHVSAANDGGPHTIILPGGSWHPAFQVMDRAGTYWYHPHLHHKTNEHVSKGIAGFVIVRDSAEAALNLPRHYGVDDFPVVVQTKTFSSSKQDIILSNADTVVMANATLDANLTVPAQMVRLRLLNGSSQRVFNFGLSGNKSFYQIASDGGLLSAPVQLTRLMLAPGERAEIVIDFSSMQNQSVYLMSYASELPDGIYGATNPGIMSGMTMTGYNPNPLNGSDFNILKFNVGSPTSNPVTSLPASLVTVTPIPPSQAQITRTLTLSPKVMGPNQLNGQFVINGVSFDMSVINYTIPLNHVEIWQIKNQSAIAHPFHIHDVQFYILDRNGVAPPVNERGRKDVVLVKPQETVRFITVFEDFADDTVPYMYHCHMLTHEDGGMMGQFRVVSNAAGISSQPMPQTVQIFPNPSWGKVKIQSVTGDAIHQIEIYGPDGRLLRRIAFQSGKQEYQISRLPHGIWFLRITTGKGVVTKKAVIQ